MPSKGSKFLEMYSLKENKNENRRKKKQNKTMHIIS